MNSEARTEAVEFMDEVMNIYPKNKCSDQPILLGQIYQDTTNPGLDAIASGQKYLVRFNVSRTSFTAFRKEVVSSAPMHLASPMSAPLQNSNSGFFQVSSYLNFPSLSRGSGGDRFCQWGYRFALYQNCVIGCERVDELFFSLDQLGDSRADKEELLSHQHPSRLSLRWDSKEWRPDFWRFRH